MRLTGWSVSTKRYWQAYSWTVADWPSWEASLEVRWLGVQALAEQYEIDKLATRELMMTVMTILKSEPDHEESQDDRGRNVVVNPDKFGCFRDLKPEGLAFAPWSCMATDRADGCSD